MANSAVATGFGAALKPDDYTFATYRGHAHSLARGMDPGAALAELCGRENGVLGGKGGSMHLTDVEKGAMGSYAIIGAHLPVAAGAALSAQYRGTKQIAIAGTIGDGPAAEFWGFVDIWQNVAGYMPKVLKDPKGVELPTQPGRHRRAGPRGRVRHGRQRPADRGADWHELGPEAFDPRLEIRRRADARLHVTCAQRVREGHERLDVAA